MPTASVRSGFSLANQHINPTNVCVLRNTCVFCWFAKMPKEEGAYTRSLDEVYEELLRPSASSLRIHRGEAFTDSFGSASH